VVLVLRFAELLQALQKTHHRVRSKTRRFLDPAVVRFFSMFRERLGILPLYLTRQTQASRDRSESQNPPEWGSIWNLSSWWVHRPVVVDRRVVLTFSGRCVGRAELNPYHSVFFPPVCGRLAHLTGPSGRSMPHDNPRRLRSAFESVFCHTTPVPSGSLSKQPTGGLLFLRRLCPQARPHLSAWSVRTASGHRL